MCKEGWCVGLGQEEVAWEWLNCLKYLKTGYIRKDRKRNKRFKKGRRKLGQGLGALKKAGLEPPHELCYIWTDFISCTCFCTLFMLHASTAFKGGDIHNYWEGGEPYLGGLKDFMGGLDNPWETMFDVGKTSFQQFFNPVLQCKSNDRFLYEMQHLTKLDEV